MLRDIQARGYDVLNQIIDIQPQKIPINSIPEFYIDVRNGSFFSETVTTNKKRLN